jgi:C1A family cysteine protease
MIILKRNRSVLTTASGVALTRRHFVQGTATLAGGLAGGVLPLAQWAEAATTQKPNAAAAPTPVSYDPRTQSVNYLTSVKNQDSPSPCNSCTAFAVVATVEATFNKGKNKSGAKGPDLDELDLFSHPGPPGGCATTHWWPKEALQYCQNTGLKWETGTNPKVKIAAPTPLLDDSNMNKTQSDMKDWIFKNGPVVAVMVQYEDFADFGKAWAAAHGTQSNPNVYAPSKKAPGKIVGGHTISIVGYTANDHWICKNSWGSAWNGDGYVRIAQGKQNGIGETYIDRIDVWGVSVLP